jgi:colanic acid biosynthesis glycosyl transferase WcaI
VKILIHGINFAPEQVGIGKYTGEMAVWLAAAGHDVRVVAAPPYYPHWRVGAGYSAGAYTRQQWQGVQVWRTPLWVPARPGGMKRVVHLLSFAASSLPVLLRQVLWQPDVVWVAAPAFVCAPGAWMVARLCGAAAWLHVQDFEVDVAFHMGLLRGQRALRWASALERFVLRRFDTVSTISQRMLARLHAKGVPQPRATMFRNWVDVQAIVPASPAQRAASAYRTELGLAPDAVVALFSGTLGAKQGLHLLPQAALALRTRVPNLVIVICGDGVMQPELQAATAGLPNVRMLPLQPKERLGELLGTADIHLLPQDGDAADLVMPSKLSAMLSSGRPVVTTARAGTELATVVAGCGLVAEPGEPEAFYAALESLAQDEALRTELGHAARAYAEEHLSVERVLARFEQDLLALVAGKAGRGGVRAKV